eukprot:660190-Hanusia_phi.AAC.1
MSLKESDWPSHAIRNPTVAVTPTVPAGPGHPEDPAGRAGAALLPRPRPRLAHGDSGPGGRRGRGPYRACTLVMRP